MSCTPSCVRPRIGSRLEHCTVCHETFSGTQSGDAHRTGRHGVRVGPEARRCLSRAELEASGLWMDQKGIWHGRRAKDGQPRRRTTIPG